MKAFLIFEGQVLLEYDATYDSYQLYVDDGFGFHYEAYSDVKLESEDYYVVHLDDINQVPITQRDVWVDVDEVLSFLNHYQSKTQEGRKMINGLVSLFELLISREIIV